MNQEELIPPGSHWSGIIKAGETLRIVDLEGSQGVDFLCYNADNTKGLISQAYPPTVGFTY